MRQITYKTKIDEETLQFLFCLKDTINNSDEVEAELDFPEPDYVCLVVRTKIPTESLPAADPYISTLLLDMKMNQMEEQMKWGKF